MTPTSRFALSILTTLCLAAGPAHAGKEQARDVATGLSVLGEVADLIPTGITRAAGTGARAAQGIAFIGMGLWNAFAAAPLTPNPNHATLATVTPAQLMPLPGATAVHAAVNASLLAGNDMIDGSRLVMMSLQLYYGALADGNIANAALQQASASQHLFSLEADLLAYRLAMNDLSAAVQSDSDFTALQTTVASLLALRNQIVATGFPANEAFVFAQIAATAEEMSWAVAEVGLATGTTLTDADLTGAVIFDRYATALGFVDLRALLPVGFSVVATAPTLPLVLIALVALAWARQRRS